MESNVDDVSAKEDEGADVCAPDPDLACFDRGLWWIVDVCQSTLLCLTAAFSCAVLSHRHV